MMIYSCFYPGLCSFFYPFFYTCFYSCLYQMYFISWTYLLSSRVRWARRARRTYRTGGTRNMRARKCALALLTRRRPIFVLKIFEFQTHGFGKAQNSISFFGSLAVRNIHYVMAIILPRHHRSAFGSCSIRINSFCPRSSGLGRGSRIPSEIRVSPKRDAYFRSWLKAPNAPPAYRNGQ